MDNYKKDNIAIKYKNYIHEMYSMFDRIINLDCLDVEFSSIAKYQLINIMFKMQDILKLV